jgi:hypothetical protein
VLTRVYRKSVSTPKRRRVAVARLDSVIRDQLGHEAVVVQDGAVYRIVRGLG